MTSAGGDRPRLLVATRSEHKLRELRQLLALRHGNLVTLDDAGVLDEPVEDGLTFEENAAIKARAGLAATGLPTLADDSGLEIDALGNAPGVHSARWHGTDYAVKFRKIYELLKAQGKATSPARFVCYVTLADVRHVIFETVGVVAGEIAPEPRGTNGFGYDPIFFYPPLGRTLGEVDGEAKAAVSHRGAAFRNFKAYLLAR